MIRIRKNFPQKQKFLIKLLTIYLHLDITLHILILFILNLVILHSQ